MPVSIGDDWEFGEYFSPVAGADRNPEDNAAIREGRSALEGAAIDEHPFFAHAKMNRVALDVWTAQESVITNLFSQVLFELLSKIKNVHVRSLLAPVAIGEHSAVKVGVAFGSHPHLLSKLVRDLGIDPSTVKPTPFTREFANGLSASTGRVPYALGFLGVGNEAMLVPEYTAMEGAFERHVPREIYRPFLRANIEEDKTHCGLMEAVAMAVFRCKDDEVAYIAGAKDGVAARLEYYDQLLLHVQSLAGEE